MKKLILLLIGMLLAIPCWGAKVHEISKTKHNLSTTAPPGPFGPSLYQSDETEICIFCHTPHGGSLDAPLWNRDISGIAGANVYQHYTSETLSSRVGATNRPVNTRSLLCLSCHDGSLGVGDNLLNMPGGQPSNWDVEVVPGFGRPGPRIGGSRADTTGTDNLSDDHPISFSYTFVAADPDKPDSLHPFADVEAKGLVLFGADENVECSTCHDPHVNYDVDEGGDAAYDPFLAIPNTSSQMCLACHIK